MRRILAIVKKEFKQMRRQKQTLLLLFVVPVVQLLIFGYVLTTDVKNIDLGIKDSDKTVFSRHLIDKISNSGYFKIKYVDTTPRGVEELLKKRKVDAVLIIPEGFMRKVLRREGSQAQLIVNAMDSNIASIVTGYIMRIFENFGAGILKGSAPAKVKMIYTAWFNPELKSVYFMVPGLAGLIITIICTLLIGFSIVREKETSTLEQLSITPIKPHELLIGKMIPYALGGFLSITLALMVGKLWFHVPMRGSYLLLFGASFLYILTALSIGILIATFSTSLLQVLFLSWFSLLFAIMLSGLLIPIRNMPKFIQFLSNLTPLKFYIKMLREIFLKGGGLNLMLMDIAILSLFAVVFVLISSLLFRKRLTA
ncbi:MAG: ABC transporter permease [Candidatus Aminicenantes bacterium]|nr:ABC transporter permease [Candidatus Aminicenantes bacterium]